MHIRIYLIVQLILLMLGGAINCQAQNNVVKISGSVEVFYPLEALYHPAKNITLEVVKRNDGRILVTKSVNDTYNCHVRSGEDYELRFVGQDLATTSIHLKLGTQAKNKYSMPVILFPELLEEELSDTFNIVATNDSVMGLIMKGLQSLLADREAKWMGNYTRHYLQLLDKANACWERGDREGARYFYQKALKLSPGSAYVQSRIGEVRREIKEQNQEYSSYLKSLRAADSLFQEGKMDEARALYFEAVAMQHHDTYPNRQLSDIERWKNEQKQKERQTLYQKRRCALMIEEADSYFHNRLLEVARRLYMNALDDCKQEDYLKTQIARIDAIQDKRRRLPPPSRPSADTYHQLITVADSLMQQHEWGEAARLYERVYRMFPDLPYAHSQLVRIHLLESYEAYRQKRCNELSEWANDITLEPDSLLRTEIAYWLWAHCRFALFNEEFEDQSLSEVKTPESRDIPNDTLLSLANRNFERGAYREALKQYHQLEEQYKPNDFLDRRIKALHSLMARHMNERLRYDSLINDATILLLQNNIHEAYNKYLDLEKKDTSTFIYRQRLGIEQLLLIEEEEQALLENYRQKCRLADKHFARGNYELAKPLYYEALELAPGKVYPRIQLQTLENLMEEKAKQGEQEQKKQDTYRQLVSQADSLLSERKLMFAKKHYRQAWMIDSSSKYLQKRITSVNQLIEEQLKERVVIDSLLFAAERSYQNGNLDMASQTLKQLLKQDPQHTKAIRELAKVQALQVQQQRKQHYSGLWQEVKRRVEAERWQHACQLVQQMLKSYPDSVNLQQRADRICLQAKSVNAQWRENIREDSIRLVLMMKAQRSYESGDLDEAALLYQELIALFPDNAQVKREIAGVKQAAKRKELVAPKVTTKDQLLKDTVPVIEQEYKEAFNLPDTVERVTYLRNLAGQYPEGVTVQYAKVKGRKLTRYIVVKEGLADEYWKVEHDWGGVFYFKNGRSISYNVFKIETNP